MSGPSINTTWKAANAQYLKAVVRWVRARLELLASQRCPESPPTAPPPPVQAPEPEPFAEFVPATVAAPPPMVNYRRRGFWEWFFVSAAPIDPVPAPNPAATPQPAASPTPARHPIVSASPPQPTPPGENWQAIEAETRSYLEQLSLAARHASLDMLPALARLRILFELSPFEENVLRLCIAAELIYSVDSLCAKAQDDSRRPYPTLNLALQLFDSVDEDYLALSSSSPLRRWQLIEIIQPAATPLFAAALRIDERILEYCQGTQSLDHRLAALGAIVSPEEVPPVSPSRQGATNHLADIWAHESSACSVIHLSGPDTGSKLAVAVHAAGNCRRQVFRLHAEQLPAAPAEVDLLARIWLRERLLYPLVLFLDADERMTASGAAETETAETDRGHSSTPALARFLNQVPRGAVVSAADARVRAVRSTVPITIARATPVDQANLWQQALNFVDPQYPGRLASQFSLDESAIFAVAGQVRNLSPGSSDEQTLFDQVWTQCRVRTRPRIDGLAQRVEPAAREIELVLASEARQQLEELEAQVSNRWRVYEDWGVRNRLNRGLGITAMFAGESGTGKTSAAGQIARRLNLDLYRIDLSAVINKYIGETEKNLRRLFDACEDCGVVLCFDECDAVFGKRTETKDSHDRYANIEVSYLLQRIESYRGLCILATNKPGAVDSAFLRRLRFVINFPLPLAEQRREIWQRLLPEKSQLPTEDLNYDWLATFDKLTGGAIHAACLHAAFLAAQRGRSAVTMEEARDAIKAEYTKLNLPFRATELQLPPSRTKGEAPPSDSPTDGHVMFLPTNRTDRILA